MIVRALIMAGGAGTRMSASRTHAPAKPMVLVLGVPLVERNLTRVLCLGFVDIVIAVEARSVTARWARTEGAAIATAWGARLEVVEETERLGTLGSAALVAADALLVTYADNLTDLDLAAVVADHLQHGPAMTVCTHLETMRIPYGVARVESQRLLEYREKPSHDVPIASGIFVLGREAISLLAPGRRTDAPELVNRLLASGSTVRAFSHSSSWIDVNDDAAVVRAERLISSNPRFERWAAVPDVEVVGAVLSRESKILLEWRDRSRRHYAGLWDTPGGQVRSGEAPAAALARELDEELGLRNVLARKVATFDDLDLCSRLVFRHHVFFAVLGQAPEARENQRLLWTHPDGIAELEAVSPIVRRSIAASALKPEGLVCH
jgi:NDP-sugar pyrophosphorylase family protein